MRTRTPVLQKTPRMNAKFNTRAPHWRRADPACPPAAHTQHQTVEYNLRRHSCECPIACRKAQPPAAAPGPVAYPRPPQRRSAPSTARWVVERKFFRIFSVLSSTLVRTPLRRCRDGSPVYVHFSGTANICELVEISVVRSPRLGLGHRVRLADGVASPRFQPRDVPLQHAHEPGRCRECRDEL